MVLGRSVRALKRLLGGLQRSVGRSWRALGCHVGAQDGSKIQKISKKVRLQEAGGSRVFFLMVFVSKISSRGDINSFKYIGKIVLFRLSAVLT